MSVSEFVVHGIGILRIERYYRRCRKAYFLNDEPISADEYYFLFRENYVWLAGPGRN